MSPVKDVSSVTLKRWMPENCLIERQTINLQFLVSSKMVKNFLDMFLAKFSPYPFITTFENFQPSIHYNDDSLRIVNSFYLAKGK